MCTLHVFQKRNKYSDAASCMQNNHCKKWVRYNDAASWMYPCTLKRKIIISVLCFKGQNNDGTDLCKLMFGVAQIAPHISQSFLCFLFGVDNNFGG